MPKEKGVGEEPKMLSEELNSPGNWEGTKEPTNETHSVGNKEEPYSVGDMVKFRPMEHEKFEEDEYVVDVKIVAIHSNGHVDLEREDGTQYRDVNKGDGERQWNFD
jgi:hypothetical protein